jgi:hypothetical protein
MGNRGVLHNEDRHLVREFRLQRWLICELSYRGVDRKPLMKPGEYTELFFLDEATALASGHRPCAQCRNQSYKAFRNHWLEANEEEKGESAKRMDACLHAERTNRRADGDWWQPLSDLSAGVIVLWNEQMHLWTGVALAPWTSTGYGPAIHPHDCRQKVHLCTPPSISRAIAAGYVVQTHPSAAAKA